MKKREMIQSLLKWGFLSTGVLMAVWAIDPNPAQAEIINGEVIEVKEDGSSFVFKRADPSNPSVSEQFTVAVQPNTQFENIKSLDELAAGDEVAAEAQKRNESGVWDASAVKILKVKLHEDVFIPLKPAQKNSM